MKFSNMILICACVIGLTQIASAQKVNGGAGHGISGYLDPQTGAFKPTAHGSPVDLDAASNAAPTTGTFVFKFTITIKSTNLKSSTVVCAANASVFPQSSANDQFIEEASIEASTSGSTRTCTVTIPYSWTLTAASTDLVDLSYDITAGETTPTAGTRLSSHTIGTIKVPANGATTTETFAVTL